MQTVDKVVSLEDLKKMSEKMYGKLVKAVVDVEKNIMVIDVGMHSDAELFMLENGSKQKNLWGINIHPNNEKENWVEFDSMINIRPYANNRSRGVDNQVIQKYIISLVNKLVKE